MSKVAPSAFANMPASTDDPSPYDPGTISFHHEVMRWTRAITCVASRYSNGRLEADDLRQEARIALWRATTSYKPLRGIPFENYARRVISNRVRSAIGSRRRSPQNQAVPELEDPVSPGGDAPSDLDEDWARSLHHEAVLTNDDPAEHFYLGERAQHVGHWAYSLPPILGKVYSLLYEHDLTQREAAAELGVTQARVSQLHAQLLKRGRIDLADLVA